ncbi:MAG: hypothetical protein CM15mP74_01080 [Halieaceae bacterium]|nr:MAG: hypothetical protein CM15mP74_01080 [Halieaceae bacterium]
MATHSITEPGAERPRQPGFFFVPGTATSLLMAARSMNTSVEKWRG